MYDWNDLRYFLELSRQGKLVRAAKRLHVDHTTVSRRVTALEKQLDVRQPGRKVGIDLGKGARLALLDQIVEERRKDAAGAILYAAETATKLALDAIQLLGGNGYINEYPTGRLLRDAKLYEIGAGTSEIRRFLIGRELFGETA